MERLARGSGKVEAGETFDDWVAAEGYLRMTGQRMTHYDAQVVGVDGAPGRRCCSTMAHSPSSTAPGRGRRSRTTHRRRRRQRGLEGDEFEGWATQETGGVLLQATNNLRGREHRMRSGSTRYGRSGTLGGHHRRGSLDNVVRVGGPATSPDARSAVGARDRAEHLPAAGLKPPRRPSRGWIQVDQRSDDGKMRSSRKEQVVEIRDASRNHSAPTDEPWELEGQRIGRHESGLLNVMPLGSGASWWQREMDDGEVERGRRNRTAGPCHTGGRRRPDGKGGGDDGPEAGRVGGLQVRRRITVSTQDPAIGRDP